MDDEEVYEDDQQRFEAEVQQWQQQEQHEDEQMLKRKDFLNELVKKNHLVVEEDIFSLPVGGKKIPIITRTGIEKIQYINNIKVTFDDKVLTSDFAVIKAFATDRRLKITPCRLKHMRMLSMERSPMEILPSLMSWR